MTMRSGYKEIQHTADWALQVWAPDLTGLMQQAALGMIALMGARLRHDRRLERTIMVSADDNESLLVAFLNSILYEMELDSVGFDRFELKLDGLKLHARLAGAPLLELQKSIKAVTFHNLEIRPVEAGLETTIVFDV
ncbi:MAG: archease [Chloroflexi bacterium]|jgi:SHS2 domain-containing protein|nr:MAG: archease [Chloroflexota bacterium]